MQEGPHSAARFTRESRLPFSYRLLRACINGIASALHYLLSKRSGLLSGLRRPAHDVLRLACQLQVKSNETRLAVNFQLNFLP